MRRSLLNEQKHFQHSLEMSETDAPFSKFDWQCVSQLVTNLRHCKSSLTWNVDVLLADIFITGYDMQTLHERKLHYFYL